MVSAIDPVLCTTGASSILGCQNVRSTEYVADTKANKLDLIQLHSVTNADLAAFRPLIGIEDVSQLRSLLFLIE
jgi:hypothetical protein